MTTAMEAHLRFQGEWVNVAAYMDRQAANWLEEHTERIRLEERLKLARYTPDWLSVENELPPQFEAVIATNGKTCLEAKYYPYAGKLSKHGWYQIDGALLGVSWATHWTYFPEPPTSDDENR